MFLYFKLNQNKWSLLCLLFNKRRSTTCLRVFIGAIWNEQRTSRNSYTKESIERGLLLTAIEQNNRKAFASYIMRQNFFTFRTIHATRQWTCTLNTRTSVPSIFTAAWIHNIRRKLHLGKLYPRLPSVNSKEFLETIKHFHILRVKFHSEILSSSLPKFSEDVTCPSILLQTPWRVCWASVTFICLKTALLTWLAESATDRQTNRLH